MKILRVLLAYVLFFSAFNLMAEVERKNLKDMPSAEELIGRILETSDNVSTLDSGDVKPAYYYYDSWYYNYGHVSNVCRSGYYYCYTGYYHYIGSPCACYDSWGYMWFAGQITAY